MAVAMVRSMTLLLSTFANCATAANVTWGIQPAVDVGFAQAPECGRLASRDARYPGSFAFTAGVAVFALATAQDPSYVLSMRVLGFSLDAHLPDVPRFALELDRRPEAATTRIALERSGWTPCAVPAVMPRHPSTFARFRDQFVKLHLFSFVAFEKVVYLDGDTLAVGSLAPLLAANVTKDRPIAATRDIRGDREGFYVESFNMGAAVLRPDEAEFAHLLKLLEDDAVTYETVMSEQGWLNAVYKHRWIELPATLGANLAIWTYKPDDWRALEPDLRLIHYTMKKPFQGCDDKHAPICARWHAARAAMDAADRRNDAIAAAHPATLVTGYWQLSSKHSKVDYRGWIANFLRIRAPTVFFSAPNNVEQFRRDRAALGLGNLTRAVAKSIDHFHTHRAFADHFRDHFARLDPERSLHKSPHLYAASDRTSSNIVPEVLTLCAQVWAEKLELLEVARRRRFFGTTTAFFWLDIGILRDRGPNYHLATGGSWPDANRVAAIVASGRVAITSVARFTEEELQRTSDVNARFLKANHVCACAFGGSLAALRKVRTAYYALTQTFIDRGIFSGKDQSARDLCSIMRLDRYFAWG